MAQAIRWFLGRHQGTVDCTLHTRSINNQSVVLVAASEGDEGDSSASPRRFLGSAHIRVENIAPFEGDLSTELGMGLRFRVVVDWSDPLPIWADIFVADEAPHGFIRSR
jgi:hypothetical protein